MAEKGRCWCGHWHPGGKCSLCECGKFVDRELLAMDVWLALAAVAAVAAVLASGVLP